MKQQARFWLAAVMGILLVLAVCPGNAFMEKRVVRVGCFPIGGLVYDGDDSGVSGYQREYLNELAKYAPWRYEYVIFGDWQEALQALQDGRIDLIGFAQETEVRKKVLGFSEYPGGMTFEAIFSRETDPLLFEDFAAFSDKRIGVLADYIRRGALEEYLAEYGVTGNFAAYDSVTELRRALQQGEIDLLVSNFEEKAANEKVVGLFAQSIYHNVVRKSDTALLAQLNVAEADLRRRTPEFMAKLREKYFPKRERIFFSKSEVDFAKAHPPIKIGLMDKRRPLHAYDQETGRMKGILVDLLEAVAAHTGLQFEYVPITSGTPAEFLKSGGADMVAGIVPTRKNAADPELVLSEVLLGAQMGMVGRRGEPFDPERPLNIAVARSDQAAQEYAARAYPNFNIVLCGNGAEAGLNTVRVGAADVLLQNSYVLSKALQNPVYDELEPVPTIRVVENLCVAVPAGADPRLISLIDKSITALAPEVISQSVITHMMAHGTPLPVMDVFRIYRVPMLLSLLFFTVFAGCGYYIVHMRHRHLHDIAKSERILKNITNNITGGVITVVADANFTITYANDGFIDLIGYKKSEYETFKRAHGLSYVYEEDRLVLKELLSRRNEAEKIEFEFRVVRRDGTLVPTLFRGTAARDENGKLFYYCVVIDISEQKRLIQQMEREKERYRIITEQSDAIIFEIDFFADAIIFSAKYSEQFGQMPIGTIYDVCMHPDDRAIYKALLEAIRHGEKFVKKLVRLQRADERYVWCEIQGSPVYEADKIVGAIGKVIDVDEEKRERDALKVLSERDGLTGLYNKKATYALMETYLTGHGKNRRNALIFIDIDNFKSINDYQGHMKGDAVLKEITQKLKAAFRSNDIIGRFGGDEFCVFAPDVPADILQRRIEAVLRSICKVYPGETQDVTISASIGAAFYPKDANTKEGLTEKADIALYAAKERGKNQAVFYRPELKLKGYQGDRR